jgi:hypothetical protein
MGEAEVLACLEDFLESILNGTFSEIRYQTSNNIHLQRIMQLDPELLNKWKIMPARQPVELEKDLAAHRSPAYFVVRTDDWQDLFLLGTEGGGSCQRIDGDPNLSKCLLAYCLDGKNSIIAVKDQQDKIVARRVFRLLINTDASKPVLFLDKLYPANCKKEHSDAIELMAIKEASRLGLELLVQLDGSVSNYQGKVQSLGGPCPYEYADAGGGIRWQGKFLINGPCQLSLS